MPTSTSQTASTLEDYLGLFEGLSGLGCEFVVIGGCAVGAYARLLGETSLSNDLDLLVSEATLDRIRADAEVLHVQVVQWPQPRSVPVLVLSWQGQEINVLTQSEGLAPADIEARAAREFRLGSQPEVSVLIADPFDLLRNKLAVNN